MTMMFEYPPQYKGRKSSFIAIVQAAAVNHTLQAVPNLLPRFGNIFLK